jgi:hypothetical protein
MENMPTLVPILLVAGCILAGSSVQAQSYSCVAAKAPAVLALQDYALRLSGGDPEVAGKYNMPRVASSDVEVVTDGRTCRRAARAYHTAVRGPAVPQISRRVVVIKVGSTRYLVLDPAEHEGEFEVTVIFDSKFAPLLAFNS